MTTPLPASAFVIRADVLRAHADARTLRTQAEADAARIRASIARERAEALRAGFDEGMQRGLVQAAAITTGAARAVEQFWRERDTELAELALAIAHRLLADLPRHETAASLAIDAIAEHGRSTPLALRLAPEAAAALRIALHSINDGSRVQVIADPEMPPGECTLVHPRGRTEIGLLAQFRAMMQAFARDDAPMHDGLMHDAGAS